MCRVTQSVIKGVSNMLFDKNIFQSNFTSMLHVNIYTEFCLNK